MITRIKNIVKKILGPKLSLNIRIIPKYVKNFLLQYKVKELESIRIETSSACNLRCVYCPTGTKYNSMSHKLMEKDTFQYIIQQMKDLPSLKSAVMYIGGEPLLHKDLVGMMKEIFVLTHINAISFVTNGMLLDESKIVELSKIHGDILIQISIDGRTSVENDKYRIGSDYEIIKKNVINARKKLAENVNIMISNVIIAQDSELFSQPKTPDFLLHDFGELLTGKYGSFSIETLFAQTWPGLSADFIKNKVKQRRLCLFPFQQILIRANGDLVLCCYDLVSEMVMGNIATDSIMNLVNSRKYRDVRKAHIRSMFGDLSKLPKMCKSCVFITGELITLPNQTV